MSTKFEEIQMLREEQVKNFRQWHNDILVNAYRLRDLVAERLAAPESWENPDTHEDHRYVEVISLKTKLKPSTPYKLLDELT